MEITALFFGVVPAVGSGKILAFVLRLGGTVVELKLCSAVVIAGYFTFGNRM